MTDFDSDIASLLDDVLQDKEPEQAPQVAIAEPETPTPVITEGTGHNEDTIPVLDGAPVTLESLFAEDDELGPMETEVAEATHDGEVTTVVNEDVEKAALPPIDNTMFSEPVAVEHVPIPTFTDEELMESIDIRNFGTLVSLSNRRWHAKVKDRKAAKDAADATGADAESFEARKRLLVGADEKLRKVHKAIDAARTDHYRMTLPWSTVGVNDIGKRAGARLLPNTLFFDYAELMGKHKAEMTAALDEFVAAYPTLIAISQQKLGGAFNQNEYPSPAVIESHFDLSFDFDPIPTGSEFQGLQDAQVEKLAGALKRKTQKKLENAMQDAWQRLFDDVSHAATTLANPDANFHYTLFDKLQQHATMLSHLNVTGNSEIEVIRKMVENKLTKTDLKDVRKDDALRKLLADHAKEIVDRMQEYANEKA